MRHMTWPANNTEPSIRHVLSDPIVGQLMTRDKVRDDDLIDLIEVVRHKFAVSVGRGGEPHSCKSPLDTLSGNHRNTRRWKSTVAQVPQRRTKLMSRFNSAAARGSILHVADLAASWIPGSQLKKSLGSFSDEELDRVLASVGRNRRNLFTVFKGNAKHRQRMAKMIEHYRVNLDHATRYCWDALRHADEACAKCTNTKRCRNWCRWGVKNDAPRIFCPNAELFDEIALSDAEFT